LRTAAIRTGRRAQTIYVSTPPDEEKHPNGVVFARLRKRALAGAKGVTWIEFSSRRSPSSRRPRRPRAGSCSGIRGCRSGGRAAAGDGRAVAQGNPSLGYLFDLGTLQADRVESGDREFLVEGLAAPDYWPDPDDADDGELAIDFEVWKAAATRRRGPGPGGARLEVSPRGSRPVGVRAGARTAASTAS
jgi:hypothetical protein